MSTEIQDLPGVGPRTAESLEKAGYYSVESLAVASPTEICEISGISDAIASKIITAAKEQANHLVRWYRGLEIMERRKGLPRVTTSCKEFDDMLGGGLEAGSITEFYGEFGSGKSQICHQLAVNVQLPPEQGGLEGKILWIDTEATFRPERIHEMATHLGVDPEKALNNILTARAYNAAHQMLLLPLYHHSHIPKEVQGRHPGGKGHGLPLPAPGRGQVHHSQGRSEGRRGDVLERGRPPGFRARGLFFHTQAPVRCTPWSEERCIPAPDTASA